jgi:hypothetical protein
MLLWSRFFSKYLILHSTTANTDDIQFQKYTAFEILISVKISLDIFFYLLSKDKRYEESRQRGTDSNMELLNTK